MKSHAQEPVQNSHQPLQAQQAESNLIDTRPQAAAQLRRNHILSTSPITLQQKAHASNLVASPRMALQRKQLATLQRVGKDEELQPKMAVAATLQRLGKDEELQPKMATVASVQRVGKDEELQPKMATATMVQRMGKDEELQPKMATATTLQRVGKDEELQPKMATDTALQRQEEGARPNQTGMPDQLKSGIESLSGMSMDHVKVHYNSPQPAQLNALAYAQGSDIHVGPGQEQHVPHEAWHVVQQAQGRVQPTTQMKEGIPVNNDPGLEHEADVMGAKAMSLN